MRPIFALFLLLILAGTILAQQQKSQRPTNRDLDEYVFDRVTEREYQQAFDTYWPQGYRPAMAKVETINGDTKFSLLMQRPSSPIDCTAKHLLTDQSFRKLNQELSNRDFQLTIHEEFEWSGTNRHLAVWTRASKAKPLEAIWDAADRIPASGKTHRRFRPVDRLMQQFLFENQIPGATLAISRNGKIFYERGFGYSNTEAKEEMQPATRMRIASISKPITAAAIMRLVDQGKLSLDARVFQTVLASDRPPADKRVLDITVDHLLRHRAGWDRSQSYDPMFIQDRVATFFDTTTPVGTDKIIKYMLTQKLDFDPGSREAYSNFGYCVLGRVIEKVTGMGYEEFVRREILEPLGADATVIGGTLESELLDDEAHYYTRSGMLTDESVMEPGKFDQPRQYGGWYLRSLDSHGGWISTAGDLVRFASAFDQPEKCKLMSEEAVRTMFLPVDLKSIPQRNRTRRYYAYGWMVVTTNDRQVNTFHSGKLAGTSTLLVRRFDGYNWAVLFNCGSDQQGKTLSSKIDPLIHRAVNAIDW